MEQIFNLYDYLINHSLLLVVVVILMFGLLGIGNDYFKTKKRKK